ncbi:hypothetical protein HUB94_12350 [Paenibacillus cellulosilyticus]|nr:hypothetical protein HUB94_12350 [Paenibacillus cellulosilyticus]
MIAIGLPLHVTGCGLPLRQRLAWHCPAYGMVRLLKSWMTEAGSHQP